MNNDNTGIHSTFINNNMNNRVLNIDDETTHKSNSFIQSNSFIHHLDSDFNLINHKSNHNNDNDYINQYNQANNNKSGHLNNKRKYKYKKPGHT